MWLCRVILPYLPVYLRLYAKRTNGIKAFNASYAKLVRYSRASYELRYLLSYVVQRTSYILFSIDKCATLSTFLLRFRRANLLIDSIARLIETTDTVYRSEKRRDSS